MSRFFHHTDDVITIDNGTQTLTITLAEFLTYEPAYTLPAPYTARDYIPFAYHHLFTATGQFAGAMPYTDGDSYIANLATYISEHNNPPTTLAQAKIDKKADVDVFANSVKVGGINLFSTVMPSTEVNSNQLISFQEAGSTPVGFYLRDEDGDNVPLALADLQSYNDAIVELYLACNINADTLKDSIDALGSISAVQAFNITTGWPTVPFTP